jgi:hypothetical protein
MWLRLACWKSACVRGVVKDTTAESTWFGMARRDAASVRWEEKRDSRWISPVGFGLLNVSGSVVYKRNHQFCPCYWVGYKSQKCQERSTRNTLLQPIQTLHTWIASKSIRSLCVPAFSTFNYPRKITRTITILPLVLSSQFGALFYSGLKSTVLAVDFQVALSSTSSK